MQGWHSGTIHIFLSTLRRSHMPMQQTSVLLFIVISVILSVVLVPETYIYQA